MNTIIVGGGKVGYNLFKILKERNIHVALVEKDKETCLKIAEDFDSDIIWGDGTNFNVLLDAGIENTDVIVAVTGADEENMVICQIAKLNFESMKTIARVNNPKNMNMFAQLGIDNTVCSTEVIANLIEYSFDKDDYRVISVIERGLMLIAELTIRENNIWLNKKVKELILPKECVLVSIIRGEAVIYPRGDSLIQKNDKVLVITNKLILSALITELFGGTRNGTWKN